MSSDRQGLIGSAAPFAGAPAGFDLESQAPESANTIWKQSSHPIALFFHLAFRVTAILIYILNGLISMSFVLSFVILVLLLAFDFWTVKNITGRLLVGLRWWNEVKEDGTNEWIFESRDPSRPVNASDSRIFWSALYVTPGIWAVFGLLDLIFFKFKWLTVVAVALTLSGANLIGYTRCDSDAKKRWGNLANAATSGGWMSGLVGNMLTSRLRAFLG